MLKVDVFKRRALERGLISDHGAAKQSNYILGETFGVSESTVRTARKCLEANGLIPRVSTRYCRDGVERNTSLIGNRT